MDIVDFSAWLQLFTGLNLAYAGIKDFRDYVASLTKKVIDLGLYIYEKFYPPLSGFLLKRLEAKTSQISKSRSYHNILERKINNAENEISIMKISFESLLERDFNYFFKSIFFIATLVGLTLLFLCGYKIELNELFFHKLIYTLNFLIIVYGILIFILSFLLNKIDRPLNIFVNILIILLIYVTVYFQRNYVDFENEIIKKNNLIVSMASVALPFILYFLRKIVQFTYAILYLASKILIACANIIFVNILILLHGVIDQKLNGS